MRLRLKRERDAPVDVVFIDQADAGRGATEVHLLFVGHLAVLLAQLFPELRHLRVRLPATDRQTSSCSNAERKASPHGVQ